MAQRVGQTIRAHGAKWHATLAGSKPVSSANPLADALSRIFHLPADLASSWQQLATVIVVELLVAASLAGYERLRTEKMRSVQNIAPSPSP